MACLNCNGPCSDVNSECYNGCSQIVSDKCVKYTGVDIPTIGIETGDTIARLIQQFRIYLGGIANGTNIKPVIDESIICDIISDNLPSGNDYDLVDFLKALIKSVCEIAESTTENSQDVTEILDFIDDLESEYTIECLDDVTSSSGTHAILQAVIDKLCEFITYVNVTYVKLSDIDTIIQNYLTDNPPPTETKQYVKMVPYTVVEFYPTEEVLAQFDFTGKGTGDWEKIYLCNGLNNTPDRRGRVGVGVTDGTMKGTTNPFSPEVDPVANPTFNPIYTSKLPIGANSIVLLENQMPKHKHNVGVTVTSESAPHHHKMFSGAQRNQDIGAEKAVTSWASLDGNMSYSLKGHSSFQPDLGITSSVGVTINNIVNVSEDLKGNDGQHPNIQPSIGCHYIMYIPS
jgi:hypothetical protein